MKIAEWYALAFPLFYLGLFVFWNAITYAAFRSDKWRAIRNEWRIPERTLLWLAFFGGRFGAKAAQTRLRHKTRKQPFCSRLNAIPVYWGLIALGVIIHVHIGWDTVFDMARGALDDASWSSEDGSGIPKTIIINRPNQ